MYFDIRKMDFIALSDNWTNDEREQFIMPSRQQALNSLRSMTGKDFGFHLWKWAMFYLIFEQNYVGFDVLIGKYNGGNKRWLEHIFDDYIEEGQYAGDSDET